MLLGMDHENFLKDSKEPALIPIYGRGIAMVNECLIGKGINADNIGALVRFLLGPCSCEIRRLNPGIEMLSSTNWDGAPPPEPETPSAATPTPAVSSFSATIVDSDPSPVWRNLFWVGGAVLAVLLTATAILIVRRPRADI
jgi:hypothetical protein